MAISMTSCIAYKQQNTESDESTYISDYGEYTKKTKMVQNFEDDLVPDEKTAIKIADAIWDVKYSNIKGARTLPYTVILEDNKIWYVRTNLLEGSFGMVLHIKINKYDAKILYLWTTV